MDEYGHMRDFRRVAVWEKSYRLALDIYGATRQFPPEELRGLTSQLRRCASSIPANIAEGCGRSGDAELRRFMLMAMGSCSELENHLLLAHDLGFLGAGTHQALSKNTEEVKRMLATFITKLRQAPKRVS